jgi:hypothetical protein
VEREFIDMNTIVVSELMVLLADAARDLDRGWHGVLDAVVSGEGAFGGDSIGQAIRTAYQPAVSRALDRRLADPTHNRIENCDEHRRICHIEMQPASLDILVSV